ncbi:hypothetical protein LZ30DRAFT_741958 [Colletotrichum cereale]|nr:hypothetical protein LZ30DRAFT_741958 [Colletotrichum cereale]
MVPNPCGAIDTATESRSIYRGPDTLTLHPAWLITWEASDTATLTPKLPTLTSSMLVPEWTPGQVIPDHKYDRDFNRTNKWFSDEWIRFFMIGLPIICTLFIALCVYCCCVRRCLRKRRQRRAAAATAGDAGEAPK